MRLIIIAPINDTSKIWPDRQSGLSEHNEIVILSNRTIILDILSAIMQSCKDCNLPLDLPLHGYYNSIP